MAFITIRDRRGEKRWPVFSRPFRNNKELIKEGEVMKVDILLDYKKSRRMSLERFTKLQEKKK